MSESLDGGGLARAACADQEYVVGRTTVQEGFRIVCQLLLLAVVTDDVSERERFDVLDALKLVFVVVPGERLAARNLAAAVAPVKIEEGVCDLLCRCRRCHAFVEEGGRFARAALRRFVVVKEVAWQHGAWRLVKDVGEDFHIAHEGEAKTFSDIAGRLFHRACEGVFHMSEHMEKIGAQDISGEAERFRLLDEPCGEIVSVRSVLGIFQKAQEFPDERVL